MLNKKSPFQMNRKDLKEGGDILSHKIAVPSAQMGLTSLFGMVRGEPHRYNHLNGSADFCQLYKLTY